MFKLIFLFCLGLFYGNILEYIIHRYVFHKLGRKKESLFRYHLKGHHVLAKKQGFVDLTESQVETYGMFVLVGIHLPLCILSFPLWAGVSLYALSFKIIHRLQHKYPNWTQKWMKWHWDHHMSNPNENFGVVAPWCDHIFGTRKNR